MDSSELKTCPRCSEQLNEINRLVKESCGHSKCRNCFLKEELGCNECFTSQLESTLSTNDEKIQIIETIVIQPETVQSPNLLTKKQQFPPHITKDVVDGKTKYVCLICKKSFSSRSQQYYHKFCDNTKNKPYKCKICQEAFSSSYHLKYHSEGHEGKKFQCDVCNKQFVKLIVFVKHKKIHKKLKKVCSICGMEFKDEYSFKGHMSFHENRFPFECNFCEKKFTLKTHLTQHRLVHSGKMNYECYCGKKFIRSSTYKIHMARHSKTKNYSCDHCSKEFFDKKTLDRHQKIHESNVKYQCKICDISSLRKDNITRHLKNMHSDSDINKNIAIIDINNDNFVKSKSNENSIVESKIGEQEGEAQQMSTSGEILEENNEAFRKSDTQSRIIANSSVIRCIGNVEPVIVPKDSEVKSIESKTLTATQTSEPVNLAVVHKKLKKKYDPYDIYRQILLASNDDDLPTQNTSTTNDDDVVSKNVVIGKSVKTEEHLTSNQSNFSETHWRKNFKYTYQFQYD